MYGTAHEQRREYERSPCVRPALNTRTPRKSSNASQVLAFITPLYHFIKVACWFAQSLILYPLLILSAKHLNWACDNTTAYMLVLFVRYKKELFSREPVTGDHVQQSRENLSNLL